jgi:Cys-tRNA(Pro)/Cys-tRNA(Cys) deacylase
MTPAIEHAKKNNVAHKVHEYKHDASSESYGLEAAEKLGVSKARVFKTLVVRLNDNSFAVGILAVSSMLSMKLMAKAVGAKKAVMADITDVERATGYVLGGVSPLGQKRQLKTVIDQSAKAFETIYISAGRRGLEIELSPDGLQKAAAGLFASIAMDTH